MLAFAGVATTRPAGNASLNAAPVSGTALAFVSVSVRVAVSPRRIAVGAKVLAMAGTTSTVVGSEAPLLPVLAGGSPPPATLAVLVRLAAALAATLAVSVTVGADAPTAIGLELVQVTVWPLVAQLHPVPLAPTGVSPAGSVSVTVTAPLLAPEPLFDTVSR